MRIFGIGTFWLRAAILGLLCSLALAANAYADEPGATQTPVELSEAQGQASAEGQNPGSEGPAEGTENAGGGTVTGGEGAEQTVGEQTGGEQTGGVTEGEAVTGGGGEPVEAPPSASEPTSEPGVVAVEPGAQEDAKDVPLAGAGEETPGPTSLQAVRTDSGDSAIQGARATGADEAGEESQAIPAGPLTLPPTAPTAGAAEAQASTAPAPAGADKRAGLTAAQRAAGALSCELSDLGGQASDNCTVGWLGGQRFVQSPSVDFSPVAGSLAAAATGGVPPDSGHGGAAVGNAPAGPSPGPAPGGASGAAVGGGGGGGGGAPSAFLSLAGLLLLAAPRALRRLRLSSRPWLTACFVLIPERPG